ncbi:MAG: maleylpyruvate isomerase N-terminal domain-containing protein [Pseudonocardiaceae bacterium]
MDWPQLRDEIITTTARVSDLLRALPEGDLPLSRVSWSAAELGAHLVSLARRYRRMAQRSQPFPASLSAESHREVAAVAERAPEALADLLEVEVAALLEAFGDNGEQPVWYFTVEHTVVGVGGILLGELLLHGLDLARACQRSWPVTRAQAMACLRGVLPAIVLVVDADAALQAAGTYHLHLRGGADWTFRVHEGAVSVEPGRPRQADLHLSADPVVFLLNAYGLMSSARALLSGGIIAWGRRPWLAMRFSRLFVET